jgi:hypothetical protein
MTPIFEHATYPGIAESLKRQIAEVSTNQLPLLPVVVFCPTREVLELGAALELPDKCGQHAFWRSGGKRRACGNY